MKSVMPILVRLCVVIAFTGVLVNGQSKTSDEKSGGRSTNASFNSLSREEVELLLTDVAKSNPKALQRLAEDPEAKKLQLENLKQLLAFASQAQKEGLADDSTNKQELESIRSEVAAVNYDREINKDKGPMPVFGLIADARVKSFWSQGGPTRQAEFRKFLDSKIVILKRSNPQMKDREVSEDEEEQAREFFAKSKIYESDFDNKVAAGELPKQFTDKVALQVKLQQAQFLARIYSDVIAVTVRVPDDDVARYIAEHPELSTSEKKEKAEAILSRVKAGEDFAKLANEFSEDPGNKNANGEPQGGLYKNVSKGKMVPPFEQAALALEPGQVARDIVETDFGYHIIKLEKKGQVKDPDGQPVETYDVRHILISTTYKDPADPQSRDMPVKDYVRSKLEADKERQIIDGLIASNNITVPEDFTVPNVEPEQAQKPKKKLPVPKKRPLKRRG